MASDQPRAAEQLPSARLFAVRLWREELSSGSEYRGSVRDVATDAFRSFRDWSDLVAFMVARVEQQQQSARAGGGRGGA